MAGNMIQVMGLWKSQTKDGKTYLSGSIGNIRVLVFPVTEKRSERGPDFNVCIAAKEREGNGGASEQPKPEKPEGGDNFKW